jgi:DNA polymerase III subunit gamma/tau
MSELSLSMRPKTFGEMVGSEKLIRQLQRIMSEKTKLPLAIMLSGPTGVGKTTLARIIAVSMQCKHQKEFGYPCHHCYRHRHEFNIVNLNVKQRKVEDMEAAIDGAYSYPMPGSKKRVYIIDEAHMLTDHSQNSLLEYTEDCPHTTNWIICTTRPDKIIDTLQSRCTVFNVPGLDLKGLKELIERALKKYKSERDISELAEKLIEKRITSPRLVLKAVQKYVDPNTSAEEASEVTLVSDVDTYKLCRTIVKGDWESTAKILQETKAEDNIAIRRSVSGYLNAILINDLEVNHRTDVVSKAILQLNKIGDDGPATSAVLYKVCKYFSKEKR